MNPATLRYPDVGPACGGTRSGAKGAGQAGGLAHASGATKRKAYLYPYFKELWRKIYVLYFIL